MVYISTINIHNDSVNLLSVTNGESSHYYRKSHITKESNCKFSILQTPKCSMVVILPTVVILAALLCLKGAKILFINFSNIKQIIMFENASQFLKPNHFLHQQYEILYFYETPFPYVQYHIYSIFE